MIGAFDAELRGEAWFDALVLPESWFDEDLEPDDGGGGGTPPPTAVPTVRLVLPQAVHRASRW